MSITPEDDDFIPPDIFAPTAVATPADVNTAAADPARADPTPAFAAETAVATPAREAVTEAAVSPAPTKTPKPFPLAPPIPRLDFSALTAPPAPAAPATPAASAPVPSAPAPSAPVARPAAARTPATPAPGDPTPPSEPAALRRLDRLLQRAASRGASTLYLSSNAQPSIRVDAELETIDDVPALTTGEIESMVLALMLTRAGESFQELATNGWMVDRPGIGRVRCMSFEDHRGPGIVLRIVPRRAASPEQLALSTDIQSLVGEQHGLVVIAGPRSSGKRTTISGLLDLISRSRRAHVISVERETDALSESDGGLISRREVRGGLADVLETAQAALRENPDILVLQEVRSEPLTTLALEAAGSGHLVIAGFTAPEPCGALEQILNLYPPHDQPHVQRTLAAQLRAVIGQLLLPRIGGGRAVAREVIFNAAALTDVLNHGKVSQLRTAIEACRAAGSVPLTDALVELVQQGIVRSVDAYRHAPDPGAFLSRLEQAGISTTFSETRA